MDFYIPGVPLEQIRFAGLRLQRGGVGFYPTSGSPFVHLDVGNVRHWPRMTHDQLARVFPDGRTVHVPSDGHPLKNYALALADIQKRGSSDPSQTSLDAARSAGLEVASDKPRRSLLAGLFSNRDEDEDSATAAEPAADAAPAVVPKPDRTARSAATAPKPTDSKVTRQQVASAKTTDAKATETKSGSLFNLASADSTPIVPAPSANDVIASRGLWDAPGIAQAHAEAAPALKPRIELASAESRPAPALRPRVETPPAAADTTGAVTRWPLKVAETADRVPQDVALSYAAQAQATPPVTRSLTPAMAAVPEMRLAATAKPAAPSQTPPVAAVAHSPKLVMTPEDPWLRAIVLAPDLRNYLTALALGDAPDPTELEPLMAKPDAVVAMTFCDDPNSGMSTDHFSGNAVVFVSTEAFDKRTAALQ